jgi:hypothetical protein
MRPGPKAAFERRVPTDTAKVFDPMALQRHGK